MSTENLDPNTSVPVSPGIEETSFADILSNYEQEHSDAAGGRAVNGVIISVRAENILVDIGRKMEGALKLSRWRESEIGDPVPGAHILVNVGPYNSDDAAYELSTIKVERPKDWSSLESAFANKADVAGTVVEQIKGGFRVDIGVLAFLPASRSGVRDANDMAKLVGEEIRCRITKLDTDQEDVVVDRRVLLEEQDAQRRDQAFSDLREGAIVRGRVRSVMDFGAFLDLGGVDALLHVAELSHSRVSKASDVVNIGDELEVKIIKVDPATRKISVSLKQLAEDPWSIAARTFNVGDRVSGTVSRLTDFGAFIELMPGVDGLVHVSELSWNKRVRKPADLLKTGERVEAVILGVNPAERRISLGYKQALGDPWESAISRFPVGSKVEGAISNLTPFGAFVEIAEGVEGMIHISDITNERRIDHPKDKLAKGQTVKALVLEIDEQRRRLRLGMKQLEPTTVDHYISEHSQGETVSGRLIDVQGTRARVELGEGVIATCQLRAPEEPTAPAATPERQPAKPSDVGSLSAMLAAKWKTGDSSGSNVPAPSKTMARAGEVRSFKIASLDPAKKLIELELAS